MTQILNHGRKALALAATILATAPLGLALTLVTDGDSSYVIYHAVEAAPSVVDAAAELQDFLQRATGVRLDIVTTPRERMVCLGDNPSSRAAGLSTAAVPLEGYRIMSKGRNLYIAGPDTAADERTPQGGTSTGTRNGVYTFLERFVGVRWLQPGEDGTYVPEMRDLGLPDVDLTEAPGFLNRRVPYIQERTPAVKVWWKRQKLGWSLLLTHGHNWRAVPASAFKAHPDWFAEGGGVRVPPAGEYKLCTTNQGMIRAFADAAIAAFDQSPDRTSYSLSPSDGGGWCTCADCTALYETDPNGKLSVTPAILRFYNGVARLVAEKHPDKLLCGYVYAAYVFPPKKPIRLEPNVFLVWAPSFDYGFTLFRPKLREQWEGLVRQWTQVTRNIAYYDLPNCVHNSAGAPNPPGLDILSFLYPRLKQAEMKGVYVYGNQAWGHSAAMNYLLAKLAWNPKADVEALFDEFCEMCYGDGAEELKAFYRLLDADTERFFLQNATESYLLSNGRLRDVYAHNFPDLERLYRTAERKIRDPEAKARLAMLGVNLRVLHWNLRQLKFIEAPESSTFFMADAEFLRFLGEQEGTLAVYPRRKRRKGSVDLTARLLVTPLSRLPNAVASTPFRLRGDQHIVLKPTGQDPVRVEFRLTRTYGSLLWYHVHDPAGEELVRGTLNAGTPLELDPARDDYYQLTIEAGSAFYELSVSGAAWALNGNVTDRGLHLIQKTTPFYFEVAPGLQSFGLWLAATPPGETALATLSAPSGRAAAQFDCTLKPIDEQQIDVRDGEAGVWRLDVKQAQTGVVDDVWIKPGAELSGFLSPVPEQALSVRPAE